MFALGQKTIFTPQNVMSALARITTAKADFRITPCLLYPQKRRAFFQGSSEKLNLSAARLPRRRA